MAVLASLTAETASAMKITPTSKHLAMAVATVVCQACLDSEQPSLQALVPIQASSVGSHLFPYRLVPSPEEREVIDDYLIQSGHLTTDGVYSGQAYRIRTIGERRLGRYLVINHRSVPVHDSEVGLMMIDTQAEQPVGPTWWSGVYWGPSLPDFNPLGVVDFNADGRDDLVYCWWELGEGKAHTRAFLQQDSGWLDISVDRRVVMPVDLSGLRDISTVISSGLDPYRTYCHDVGPQP